MNNPSEAIGIVAVVATMASSAVVILRTLIINIRRQRVARAQAEVMNKLIDKVGSSPELGRWLESGGAKQFFEFEALEKENPRARILNSIQTGLVALALGTGLMLVGAKYEEIQAAGIILACVGGGFLASSAVSYGLSKNWGLLDRAEPAAVHQETPRA